VLSGKASGYAKLGEVLAEHNSAAEARTNFDKAISLDAKNPEIYKARAAFLETQKQWADAIKDWDQVLALLGNKVTDRLARRDARRHKVQGGHPVGPEEQQLKSEWEAKFKSGDVEAGYYLVEYYGRRGGPKEMLKTLEDLHKRVPDDQDVTLDLVKSYKEQRKFQPAVDTLQELFKLAPSLRARDLLDDLRDQDARAQRTTRRSSGSRRCSRRARAIRTAYERLASAMSRCSGFPRRSRRTRRRPARRAHNTKAQFALAQLYIQGGTPLKATDVLRTVLRTAQNEDDIGRAGSRCDRPRGDDRLARRAREGCCRRCRS